MHFGTTESIAKQCIVGNLEQLESSALWEDLSNQKVMHCGEANKFLARSVDIGFL